MMCKYTRFPELLTGVPDCYSWTSFNVSPALRASQISYLSPTSLSNFSSFVKRGSPFPQEFNFKTWVILTAFSLLTLHISISQESNRTFLSVTNWSEHHLSSFPPAHVAKHLQTLCSISSGLPNSAASLARVIFVLSCTGSFSFGLLSHESERKPLKKERLIWMEFLQWVRCSICFIYPIPPTPNVQVNNLVNIVSFLRIWECHIGEIISSICQLP